MSELHKKDTVYQWTPEIQKKFDDVKESLTSDMIVKPFDPQLETQLLTDASKTKGLGYILMQWENENDENGKQKRRIIQCGSFALTPTQQNYQNNRVRIPGHGQSNRKMPVLPIRYEQIYGDHRPSSNKRHNGQTDQ